MKNLIYISATIIATVFQMNANTVPSHFTLNVLANQKAVILDLTNIEASSFVVLDENGVNVYAQKIEKFGTGVKYVMSKLPTGLYTIKINGNDFVEVYDAEISKEMLHINSFEVFYRPAIVEKENKFAIDALLSDNEEINVFIYNETGSLVFRFSDLESGKYNRVFDLNQLEKGDYSVIVSTDKFTESSKIRL